MTEEQQQQTPEPPEGPAAEPPTQPREGGDAPAISPEGVSVAPSEAEAAPPPPPKPVMPPGWKPRTFAIRPPIGDKPGFIWVQNDDGTELGRIYQVKMRFGKEIERIRMTKIYKKVSAKHVRDDVDRIIGDLLYNEREHGALPEPTVRGVIEKAMRRAAGPPRGKFGGPRGPRGPGPGGPRGPGGPGGPGGPRQFDNRPPRGPDPRPPQGAPHQAPGGGGPGPDPEPRPTQLPQRGRYPNSPPPAVGPRTPMAPLAPSPAPVAPAPPRSPHPASIPASRPAPQRPPAAAPSTPAPGPAKPAPMAPPPAAKPGEDDDIFED